MDAKDAWKLVLAIGVSVGLILHALLPRYEWRTAMYFFTAAIALSMSACVL
jgi:hypothetical protein